MLCRFVLLLKSHVFKYLPVSPLGLVRFSLLGSIESMLFFYSTQIETYGYFLPREYPVRRKVVSADYITVSEYYSKFLEKYPYFALSLNGDKSTGLAFIRISELFPNVRSWIALVFLGASTISNPGLKFLLLAKVCPIILKKYNVRRLHVLSQENKTIVVYIDLFLSCLI